MKKNIENLKNSEVTLDVFDTPLTDRGFLVYEAEREILRTYNCHGKFFSLAHTATILYLYGADFRGIYSFELEETHARNRHFLKFYKKPRLYFTLRNKPLIYKNRQVSTIRTMLKKSNQTTWNLYNWSTDEGDALRNEVNLMLLKTKETAKMKKWSKDFKILVNLIQIWHVDFLKQYKNKYNFQFMLYKDDETTCYFTIKDDTYDMLKNKEDIRERQWQYLQVFSDFAKYLHEGFLEGNKLFPKSLYE